MSEVLVLRTCAADGSSYNGFRWPLTVGAEVIAPDWKPEPTCGNGLHGALHGEGDGVLFNWNHDAKWLVVAVAAETIIDLGGKVKFPRCVVRFVGDRKDATDYISAHDLLAKAVIGGTSASGDHGTSTSGDYGTSTSGDYGTSTSGDYGTSTSGYRGTSTSGDYGTSTSGNIGISTSGDYGTSTSGYRGTSTSGDYGTSTSGDRGIIQIKWFDGRRFRITTGYVGENGIEPNVPYRCDESGVLVRA